MALPVALPHPAGAEWLLVRVLPCAVVSFLILLVSWLLSFAAAFMVLFEPAQSSNWPWDTSVPRSGEDRSCESMFVGYLPTLQYLIEKSLSGEAFFECGSGSDTAELSWYLSTAFYMATGLLLLNSTPREATHPPLEAPP